MELRGGMSSHYLCSQENLKTTHHADNTLKSFCKWQKSINIKRDTHPLYHDTAILLSRYHQPQEGGSLHLREVLHSPAGEALVEEGAVLSGSPILRRVCAPLAQGWILSALGEVFLF